MLQMICISVIIKLVCNFRSEYFMIKINDMSFRYEKNSPVVTEGCLQNMFIFPYFIHFRYIILSGQVQIQEEGKASGYRCGYHAIGSCRLPCAYAKQQDPEEGCQRRFRL